MVELVRNFTVDTLDSEGRNLVGDNHVTQIVYHDASFEAWKRDFADVSNPFLNADFTDVTVTGTGPFDAPGPGWYETGSDATTTDEDKFFKLSQIPFNFEDGDFC